ncbi:ribosomal protein L10e/L16 [Papiliotrema laurentii]|uniref:Ribosomal protein L10e/L16 n=1 Tax=Papiliotrema laurentii TaxID=5418 RepID=A0AAD9CSP6_PAPLA|nr:ribosomal protein L10e/L16 [Papiliotrema laurentii]
MFGSLRSPLSSLIASSSSSSFASTSRHAVRPILRRLPPTQPVQVRYRNLLAPRRWKYRKSRKGFPITAATGGSIKGTTVARGQFGLRLLEPARLSAAILTTCRDAIKKKIKAVKGAQVYLRVFPDVPVAVKGNEVRMGKGKGSFEFWAARVRQGKVVFEVGGGGIREEIAKAAFKLAQAKLPVKSEIITTASAPRLGNIVSHDLKHPVGAQPIPALLETMEKKIGRSKVLVKIGRRKVIRDRERRAEFGGLKVRAPLMQLQPEA